MGFYDVLDKVGKETNWSMQGISGAMGNAKNHIANAKSRGSVPSIDNAVRMLNICGYALCAMPSNRVDKEYMYEITTGD